MTKIHDLPKGGHSAMGLWIILRSSSKRGRQVWWGFPEDMSSLLALWHRNSSGHVVQLFSFLRPGPPCLTTPWVAGALEWGIWLRGENLETVIFHVVLCWGSGFSHQTCSWGAPTTIPSTALILGEQWTPSKPLSPFGCSGFCDSAGVTLRKGMWIP